MALKFLLGIPRLRGALLDTARRLNAPVLVSANAFSIWKIDGDWMQVYDRPSKKMKRKRIRDWTGFKHPSADLIGSIEAYLDSAGFVAAVRYGGFPWPVAAYLDLAASAPWKWWASMDLCVEPEIARDDAAVLDRISGTAGLNMRCAAGAAERGILDRFMPVIQGWEPRHYLRCMDRMSSVLHGVKLVGVGSMCRRHVEGTKGVLQVVDALDRAAPAGMQFHLFGLKSQAMAELRGHPRIASVDSQAYGVEAQKQAHDQRADDPDFSKSDVFVAGIMEKWYLNQTAQLSRAAYRFRSPTSLLDIETGVPNDPFFARIAREREGLRKLYEQGLVGWREIEMVDQIAYECAGCCEEYDDIDEPL